LAAKGTPVRSHSGEVILPATDARVAAVVALDIGKQDLQQCADTVLRLHAEWSRASGRTEISYKSLSGFSMDYARYRVGERFVLQGKDLAWRRERRASDTRADFRAYLDSVFMWAGTSSLARDARKVRREELRSGDFFVMAGSPGHAVIVLDLAQSSDGRRYALLGQGFMPAQNLHVLRSAEGDAWFSLDASEVRTPFWRPFPWSSLRRLE
jgi:hypothetical protein